MYFNDDDLSLTGFEADPEGEDLYKCLICSNTSSTADIRVKKRSRTVHLNSQKHKNAVQEMEKGTTGPGAATTNERSADTEQPEVHRAPVTLSSSILERFGVELSDSEDEGVLQERHYNPFDEVVQYGDEIYGEDGKMIILSAGIMPVDQSRSRLVEQMENLESYTLTSAFGKITGGISLQDDLEDDTDDLTVPEISDTLRAMGEHIDSRLPLQITGVPFFWMTGFGPNDSEETNFGNTVNPRTFDHDFDPHWAPHGSKTVKSR